MERVEEVLSVLDVAYQFPRNYMRQVTGEALQFRDQVSQGARDSLNAAINNSGIRLDGFRDVSKADADTLAGPAIGEIAEGNEKLLRSVLRTWMESREVLRAQVAEGLSRLGVPTDGLWGRGDGAISIWEESEWSEKLRILLSEVKGADELDVKLMMTCVSGLAPEPPEEERQPESEMFSRWLDELRGLPAEASDWDELEAFVRETEGIAQEKVVERARGQINELEQLIGESEEEFGDELEYLEIDLKDWVNEAQEYPAVFPQAVLVAKALWDNLSDYVKLWAIGRTRSEEAERRVVRELREDFIFGLVSEWRELVSVARSIKEEIGQTVGVEEETEVGVGAEEGEESEAAVVKPKGVGELAGGAEVGEVEIPLAAAVAEELEEARRESGRLREERAALDVEKSGLEVQVSDLEGEVDRFRQDLYESQQNEKVWREQFVSVSKSVGGGKGEDPGGIADVEDAVERARRAFPNELVVVLNSKSDVATPFKRPDEVYSVLAWLSTEYHRARTREVGRDPQFDKLLKEACSGWFYKPKQTDETKDQYPEWYRTRVEDREYELDMHVGKGTSFDPQNTIRVAFDWDEEETAGGGGVYRAAPEEPEVLGGRGRRFCGGWGGDETGNHKGRPFQK